MDKEAKKDRALPLAVATAIGGAALAGFALGSAEVKREQLGRFVPVVERRHQDGGVEVPLLLPDGVLCDLRRLERGESPEEACRKDKP
jgi:hypothetical protein